MKISKRSYPNSTLASGFSLVITITLMVLLSLVAVGLLSLSSIVLRASSADASQLEARANARLALSLAIGQLQSAAGPDQRITAPADLLDANASPAITGVWESLRLDPLAGQDLDDLKRRNRSGENPDGEFITWLNSDSYANPNASVDQPLSSSGQRSAALLDLPGVGPRDDVSAEILPVTNGGLSNGGLAWLTIDESVKARFNLPDAQAPTGPDANLALRDRLRNPERFGADVLAEIDRIPTIEESGKIVSFEQGALFSAADRETFRARFHDITPWSLGLLTDAVDGGFKKDLTQAFENDSPSEDPTNGLFVYSQTANALAPADPYMSTLREYYRLYRERSDISVPLQTSVPDDYRPFTIDRRTRVSVPRPISVDGAIIAPVVSRVNVVFSLVSRPAHGIWQAGIPRDSGDRRRNYMVYLVYTPVVTLYNPYTTPITVDSLSVQFEHLPLAFKFFRNGLPQTLNHGLLSQFHIQSQNRTDWEDSFQCTLTEQNGSGGGGELTLSPGEARVFGLNHPARTRWDQMTNYLFQAGSLNASLTADISTAQGYNQGNSGFIVDWLAPNEAGRTPDNHNLGVFGVRPTDRVNVEFTPRTPTDSRGNALEFFSVNISARLNGSSRATQIGAYRYTYGSQDRLITALQDGEHPELGPVTYPASREKDWAVNELIQPNIESTPVEAWTGPKQFAVFSLATRTAHDSLYPTRPGRDTSFVHNVIDMDITQAHPATMPMEISFLPVIASPGSTNNVGSVEVWSNNDPRTFFFSGWTVDKGFVNYPSIEVPRTPPTNLTQLSNANLVSSGHLPMPGQTIGDSHASPVIPADRAIDTNSDFGYATVDHSWLANNALYDGFYLSGIRTADEFTAFLDNQALPYARRTQPYLPQSESEASAATLFGGNESWRTTAAFQMTKGPFNVNSTSVLAWKALLSSLRGAEIPLVDPNALEEQTILSENSPFPRNLDNPGSAIPSDGGFMENQLRWTGFRDLTDAEVQTLAESIVNNVRLRGPFTSLSEFVNRRLDGNSDDFRARGTLEQAILESGINDAFLSDRGVTQQDAGNFNYANPSAAVGDVEAAAAANLTQSDLMSVIGNSVTVRGDTFIIRAYGESLSRSGQVVSTARCEAVVQRIPDLVAPEDRLDRQPAVTADSADLAFTNQINERFGRQFVVSSFRWLSPQEV